MMENKLLRKSSTSGFTLIEMLVVLVMISILFLIAAPSWLAFTNGRRAETARDQLQQAIRLAQSEALRTRLPYEVFINRTQNPPRIIVKRWSVSAIDLSVPKVTDEVLGYGNLSSRLVSLTSPTIRIVFDSNGVLDAQKNSLLPTETTPINLTIKVPANTGSSRCLMIENLLGATRSIGANDSTSDNCI